jgi:hypothetical protein
MTTDTQVAKTIALVAIKDIKSAPWNPPNRVEERRLRGLQQSIEDIGMIYPVILDENKNLVDGHRRVAISRRLGWKHVPAITITSEFEHAYGSIQLNQMKLSGNDILGVYLSNPNALIGSQRAKPAKIDERCGRKTLELLYKTGHTHTAFDYAMRLVRYLEGKVDVETAIRWLVKHSMAKVIRPLMAGGIPAKSLLAAITADRPIKIGLKEIA